MSQSPWSSNGGEQGGWSPLPRHAQSDSWPREQSNPWVSPAWQPPLEPQQPLIQQSPQLSAASPYVPRYAQSQSQSQSQSQTQLNDWAQPQSADLYQQPWQSVPTRALVRRKSNPLVVLFFVMAGVFGVTSLVGALASVVVSSVWVDVFDINLDDSRDSTSPNDESPEATTEYAPSKLPQPLTYYQATLWLQDNDIYAQSVTVPANCALKPIDAGKATVEELEAHLNELTACLQQVWSPPLVAASFEIDRPPVTVYEQPITTGCGKIDDVNATYCSADQRIYYYHQLTANLPSEIQSLPKPKQGLGFSFASDIIVAHEFGHAVQARAGILLAENAWEDNVDKEKADEYSRRAEMQADCFEGLFVHAVADASGFTQEDLDGVSLLTFNLGDDILAGEPGLSEDHGTGENRQKWVITGQTSTQIGACNTFTVAKSKVR